MTKLSRRSLLGIAVLGLTLGAGTAEAGQILYAVTGAGGGASTLYTLDPTTGAATTVGATGFSHVTGLAFDPTTGNLYGHVSDLFNSGVAELIQIDPNTGAGTLIGSTGLQVPDMTFSKSGTLYAWSQTDDSLHTIDKTTGTETPVGPSGIGTSNTGLAFNSSGTLYMKSGSAANNLYTVDTTTGSATLVEQLSQLPLLNNSLAFDRNDNLFSVSRSGGTSFLEQIDIANGTVTELGDIGVDGISALAFQPTAIPEPATFVSACMAGGIGLVYAWRRRRAKSA